MVWLPDGEKNFEYIFISFDRMYERDRHKDRQTDGHRISRAYIASRGKNYGSNGRPAHDSELLIM